MNKHNTFLISYSVAITIILISLFIYLLASSSCILLK